MKTSNKIIVSFLTIAWLSIMASLIVSSGFASKLLISKGIGTIKYTRIKTDVRNETTVLQDFSVIHIKEASSLRVFSGDSNQLEYDEVSGGNIKPPKTAAIQDFVVRNDTLFIKNLRNASNGGYTLRVSNLEHLIVNNTSSLELNGFAQDSLYIFSKNSKLTLNDSEFAHLHFNSPPKYDLTFKLVKRFRFSLEENICNISGDFAEISGQIGNYTELYIPQETGKVDVKTSTNGKLLYKL
jgi:hypothetical protein